MVVSTFHLPQIKAEPSSVPLSILSFYSSPFFHFSANNVLFNTIVIVNGPTPPGTGVIALATSLTASKSTSPFNLPFSSGVFPTSIMTAPGFTKSFVTRCTRPTALTITSACFKTSSVFVDFECNKVTVAS